MGLLHEIFRCPNVRLCLENPDRDHPCSKIVKVQKSKTLEQHQMPEPWMGHLETAPILFLGSNPSIGTDHEYPSHTASDDEIEDFFANHFGGGSKEWTREGVIYLRTDGTAQKVRYWTGVRKRVVELLARADVTAGVDYALSEVVLCKSKEQQGVKEAVDECTSRYFMRLLSESGAKVIVSMGKVAERTIKQLYRVGDELKTFGPIKVGTLMRWFAFLPHPSAWKPPLGHSFEGNLSPQELKHLRDCLK